jgi:hypothetical protein
MGPWPCHSAPTSFPSLTSKQFVPLPFRTLFASSPFQNQIAILDLSLRSAAAQHNLICFVMDLDRQNIPNMETLLRAAKNGAEVRKWEE